MMRLSGGPSSLRPADAWKRFLFSKKEFDILKRLYRERGKVVGRTDIAAAGWPEREDGGVAPEEITSTSGIYESPQ